MSHRCTEVTGGFLIRPLVAIIAICSTVWLAVPIAQAQGLLGNDSALNAANAATRWWSRKAAESAAAAPHLLLDTDLGSPVDLAGAESSYLADSDSLPAGLFLNSHHTAYRLWGSRLADTVTPTSERGMLVYPFIQINFAGGHLPVSLYVLPLRGSDAR